MPLVKIGHAAELLGVSVQTLRKREDSGELVPDRRSEGGVRYYDTGKILGLGSEDMPTIGYARVSSHDQKNDVVRQQELLEACQPKAGVMRSSPISARDLTTKRKAYSDYWNLFKRIRRLVLTHKDRLLRFGSELIFALCKIQNIKIVIINKGEPPSFEPRT